MLGDNTVSSESDATRQSCAFLWALPRSASTTFLKSISHSQDGVFWHEPLTQVINCGATKSSRRLDRKGKKNGTETHKSIKLSGKETSGGGFVFDAKKVSLSFMKSKLEINARQNQTVFVKEMVDSIIGTDGIEDYLEWIPKGYQHTFLIRHPYQVCASFVDVYRETKSKKYKADLRQQIPDRLQCYSKMSTLLEYIKEHHDNKPIILDTDDLLSNPVGMLQAYCKDIGMPYTPSLLTWNAGDDVMKNKWYVAKQVVRRHQQASSNMYTSTFASTGFDKPSDLPSRSDLPPEILPLIDRQMPFYEELYEQSIKCYLFTPLCQRGSLTCQTIETPADVIETSAEAN